jgi:hypothetical protein
VRSVAVLTVDEIVVVIVWDALVAAPFEMHVHVRLVRQMLVAVAPAMLPAVSDLRGSLPFHHGGDGTRMAPEGEATACRRVRASPSARVGHHVDASAQGHRWSPSRQERREWAGA